MPRVSYYLRYKKIENGLPAEIIRKFTVDEDPDGEYLIRTEHGGGKVCNCPAAKSDCRHKKMLPLFDRADSGKDELFNKVSEEGRYITYLSYNGLIFNWVRGPEKPEV